MPISKDKLILILGMVCLEQGHSETLSSIRSKFQIKCITTFGFVWLVGLFCFLSGGITLAANQSNVSTSCSLGNTREANYFRNVIGSQKYFSGIFSCDKHMELK
jgi:hypothetical protein